MKYLFVVTRIKGRSWDESKPMRSQIQWDSHAEFMDNLANEGFVIPGGPLEDEKILLIIKSNNENEIRSILSDDPWSKLKILEIEDINRWTILLEAGEKS